MGSKVEYVDSSQIFAANYVRNSKAVGVLWGIFTICYAIINSVAFFAPEWLGESSESDNPAHFGLWSICYVGTNSGGIEECQGTLKDVISFSFPAFNIAALFGVVSMATALLTVVTLMLFFFCTSTKVYRICGCMQTFSGTHSGVHVLIDAPRIIELLLFNAFFLAMNITRNNLHFP